MKRQSITLVSTLIGALLLPVAPVTAATVNISPTSQITFDNIHADAMRFDALGRAWIWNYGYVPGDASAAPRLAIFEKVSGAWSRVQTVKAKKRTVMTVRFDDNGQPIATVSGKNELVKWRVSDSGVVGKSKRIELRGRGVPLDAFPTSSGSLFVLYRNRIVEFDLPLRRKERPVRTIVTETRAPGKLVALSDGTIFVMQGDSNNTPVDVFGSNQSGAVEPVRTILIDAGLSSNQYASDIALSPDGKVTVAYWSAGVALFDISASGGSLTPATWYPQEAPVSNIVGVDFGPNGVMGLLDYNSLNSVKVFFEE
jgi:hypothetical protein